MIDNVDEEFTLTHNKRLFSVFYIDLEKNALPIIPKADKSEVQKYVSDRERFKQESLKSSDIITEFANSNLAIPVEVEIWVDKVFDYYFKDLIPVLGQIYATERARQTLYRYKGYKWYTIIELYPYTMFD